MTHPSNNDSNATTATASDHPVSLSIEPVQVYPSETPLFYREPRLVDISASGVPTYSPFEPSSLQLSQRVRRLWSERGDFSKFSLKALESESLSSPPSSPASPPPFQHSTQPVSNTNAQETEETVKGGKIRESEFVELRDTVLSRLDLAHFSAIHAHQLLGMLIRSNKPITLASSTITASSVRGASPAPSSASTGTATKPEPEFVLDPLSVGLSRVTLDRGTGEEPEEDDPDLVNGMENQNGLRTAQAEASAATAGQRIRDMKIALAQKREGLKRAAQVLRSGAKELREAAGPERERWKGLREAKMRGWRVTPGRPLIDIERFGGQKTALAGLEGFGTPILTSDGKIKEEGARDAWIGYGMPESSIDLRRRTLAYWKDERDAEQKLVFPDRPKRKLRVKYRYHIDNEDEQVVEWISREQQKSSNSDDDKQKKSIGEQIDADLRAASSEMVDEAVFAAVVSQTRQLVGFHTKMTDISVAIAITPQIDLVIELVEQKEIEEEEKQMEQEPRETEEEENIQHQQPQGIRKDHAQPQSRRYSAIATATLAFLRFSPIRRWNDFMAALAVAREGDTIAKSVALRAQALAVPKRSTLVTAPQASSLSASNHPPSSGSMPTPPTSSSSSSAGPTPHGPPPPPSSSSSNLAVNTAAAQIHKLPDLGPFLISLHYFSMIRKLEVVLSSLQSTYQDRCITFDLCPVLTQNEITDWLEKVIEAPSSPSSDLDLFLLSLPSSSSSSSISSLSSSLLKGITQIRIKEKPFCTIWTFSPSHVLVLFRFPFSDFHQPSLFLSLDLVSLRQLLRKQLDRIG